MCSNSNLKKEKIYIPTNKSMYKVYAMYVPRKQRKAKRIAQISNGIKRKQCQLKKGRKSCRFKINF